MPIFLLTLVLLTLLQVGHLHLLKRQLPERWHHRLAWGLLGFHLPLIGYFLLRLTGFSHLALMEILRPLARLAFYFQALTVLHLAMAGSLLLYWKYRHPKAHVMNPSRRAFLRGAALGSAAVATVSSAAGAFQAYGPPETPVLELPFEDLPEGLDGLRIALLSDLHVGPMLPGQVLALWRKALQGLNPDLVLYGGDFVDSRPEELAPFLGLFHDVACPLGSFAVLGNHDYFQDPRPIWQGLDSIGIRPLENTHVVLERNGARLALIGLQDPMALNGRFQSVAFGPGPDPGAARRGIPEDAFRICLNHRPSEWAEALATGAKLTLSGHTHGGQINLIPGLNSARILGPYTSGLYNQGGVALFVTRGLGVVALPMRINAPPELPLLVLRKQGFRPGDRLLKG
ncbi:MAG TPA: metallophosphoesterase [Holophagaceae bacterium]|nr:metallophosphoesterase [Holophagaceae bacterium]